MKLYKVYIENTIGKVQKVKGTTDTGDIVEVSVQAEFADPIIVGHYLVESEQELKDTVLGGGSSFLYEEIPVLRNDISKFSIDVNNLNGGQLLQMAAEKLGEADTQKLINLIFGRKIEIEQPIKVAILPLKDINNDIIVEPVVDTKISDITNIIDSIFDASISGITTDVKIVQDIKPVEQISSSANSDNIVSRLLDEKIVQGKFKIAQEDLIKLADQLDKEKPIVVDEIKQPDVIITEPIVIVEQPVDKKIEQPTDQQPIVKVQTVETVQDPISMVSNLFVLIDELQNRGFSLDMLDPIVVTQLKTISTL